MTFTMAELLDDMSECTHDELASELITISRSRPTGDDFDPITFQRVEGLPENPTVPAIGSEETRSLSKNRWVTSKTFIVLADAVGFKPGREGQVIDAAGHEWRITHCDRTQEAREYTIYCQRIG